MITKIGITPYFKGYTNYNKSNNKTNNSTNSTFHSVPFDSVTFTSNNKKSSNEKKLENIMMYADSSCKSLFNRLFILSKETGYNTVTPMHVIYDGIIETCKYMEDIDSGVKDYKSDKAPELAGLIGENVSYSVFSDKDIRKKVIPVLKRYVDESKEILEKDKPSSFDPSKESKLSDELIDYIWSYRSKENSTITPTTVLMATADDNSNEKLENFLDKFLDDINAKVMLNEKSADEFFPFSFYDDKAKNVLKNLSLGTDMFITYDYAKENPNVFLDTLRNQILKSGNKKLKYVELNPYANATFLIDTINKAKKDKDHEYIIAADPSSIFLKMVADGAQGNGPAQVPLSAEFVYSIKDRPANVKFLFYDTKNNYYSFMNVGIYNDFQEASLPGMNTEQMVKFFKENPHIMKKDIKVPFSKSAIEKAAFASAQLDGVFPEKTVDLMKKIASYNINKKEITEADVNSYLKEATSILKKSNEDNSIEVIYDTKKHLSQLRGKTSTKKEAEHIVKQIKSKKLGTKGLIIYSQDGTPGSGRKYTAQAIAGDAKVPYIEVNTMDFGTKDVDLFGSGLSPEQSMKKLFSLVTTQAEANPHKSVVLFIENFEYFSIGEMISNYHQKAMAQLLREMDKAQNAGLNILVIGSMSDPDKIGEAAMKSFKFVDKMEVSSPAFNKKERADILKYACKEQKLKLPSSDSEKEKLIKYASEITIGFPNIYLQNLAKKTKDVAVERGNKVLNKADITEAYLQLTTGRPAVDKMENHKKQIVASHECGHATNLEVMNNLAKTQQKPWHIPQKVNFVTLDPRGYYGGAVYHGYDTNTERSFEFSFSDIVCAFGGNSAENRFYGIDGSWGITADLEGAREDVESMVNIMGMGAKTGKMAVHDLDSVSDSMKQRLEDDQRVILNNAKITSDLITEVYEDFNKEFTQKYASLVGTGDCMVDGDEFRKALNEWKNKQSPEKQKEFKECDEVILEIIEATKKGIAVEKRN